MFERRRTAWLGIWTSTGLFKRIQWNYYSQIILCSGLIGMLYVSDFGTIDHFYPFLGVKMDRMYGNEQNPEVTQLFTSYTELLLCVRLADTSPFRINGDLMPLKHRIVRLKQLEKSAIGAYQRLRMGIKKWHFLHDLVHAMRHFGNTDSS